MSLASAKAIIVNDGLVEYTTRLVPTNPSSSTLSTIREEEEAPNPSSSSSAVTKTATRRTHVIKFNETTRSGSDQKIFAQTIRKLVVMLSPDNNEYIRLRNSLQHAEQQLTDAIIDDPIGRRKRTGHVFLLYGENEVTMEILACNVALAAHTNFLSISAMKLSPEVGTSAGAASLIHELFKYVRQSRPCILFIDNAHILFGVNSLKKPRKRFLGELERCKRQKHDVFVIVTSSTPWVLSEVFLRRVAKFVYGPSSAGRTEMMMDEFRVKYDPYFIEYVGNTDSDNGDAGVRLCCGLTLK